MFRELFQQILLQCVQAGLVDDEVMHIDSSQIQAGASIETLQPAFAVLADETYQRMEDTGEEATEPASQDVTSETESGESVEARETNLSIFGRFSDAARTQQARPQQKWSLEIVS